jgi:hypothetical protein
MSDIGNTPSRRTFAFARWAMLWFAVCTGFSMVAYPGGTSRDHSTRGYSVFENFGSDLGRTVGLNGEANRLGAAIFLSGLGVLILAVLACLPAFFAVYSISPSQRRWARGAAAAGCLSCLAFLGVAVMPVNLFPSLHNLGALVGWLGLLVAALLFALVTARDRRFSGRLTAGWVGLAVVVSAYIGIDCLGIVPLNSDTDLLVLVSTQKLAGVVGLLTLLVETRAAEHALEASQSHPADTNAVC